MFVNKTHYDRQICQMIIVVQTFIYLVCIFFVGCSTVSEDRYCSPILMYNLAIVDCSDSTNAITRKNTRSPQGRGYVLENKVGVVPKFNLEVEDSACALRVPWTCATPIFSLVKNEPQLLAVSAHSKFAHADTCKLEGGNGPCTVRIYSLQSSHRIYRARGRRVLHITIAYALIPLIRPCSREC